MAAVWNVLQTDHTLDAQSNPEFITTVHWDARDENGQYIGTSYGSVAFDDQHPSRSVPYANISENQCIAWVKAALGGPRVSAIEANMVAQRVEQETPTVGQGTPW